MSVLPNQVVTFGCRLNSYESEVMKDLAKQAGLENVIIVNTCAVTKEAERQAKQNIRKLARENPQARILVTGCSAQTHPELYADLPEVCKVIGNDEKMKLETYLQIDKTDRVIVNDIMSVKETASHLISGFDGKVRAFIQIQNGCDHRCTYCIIPYGRGNSRSVPIGEIVTQVKELVRNDYKEIVLTGVDVTSYGQDLPGKPALGQMIRRVLNLVPELKRLRLSSLDPVEIDEDLWDLIEKEPRLMPHLHMSLQAGDNLILKRMMRRHLREDAIGFSKKAKALRPDIVFGADLIAGFPTETEEMFQNTLRILDDCELTYLHIFPYSPRDMTPAAKMPQVPKAIIKDRAKRLREKSQERLKTFLEAQIGQTQEVLIEEIKDGYFKGKTKTFAPVIIKEGDFHIGELLNVKIIALAGEELLGSPHLFK